MNGEEVGSPPRLGSGIKVVTLESNGNWLRPNGRPRRAAEAPAQVSDPEQLAVNETFRNFAESLEQGKAHLDNLDGLGYGTEGVSPFWQETKSMISLLDKHHDRMSDLRDKRLQEQYLGMERQLRVEGEIQAGNIVNSHKYTQERRTEGMNKGIDVMRTTAGRVGIEGMTESEALTNVSLLLDEMPERYEFISEKLRKSVEKVKANRANGDTSHEAFAWEGLLTGYRADYGDLRDEIVNYMVVPLLKTIPEMIRDQKMSDLLLDDSGADIPKIERPYIEAERTLHKLGKKVKVYLEEQQRKEEQAHQGTPDSTPSIVGSDVEPHAEITHIDILEFFDLVVPIVERRKHLSADRAFRTAFPPIDRSQEAVNRTRDANVQDTERMNAELALVRSNVNAEIDQLDDERNAIRDILGVSVSRLGENIKSIETAFGKLRNEEIVLAGYMKARIESGGDVSDVEALIATQRRQLIEQLASCAPSTGDKNVLEQILQIVTGRQTRVASIAVTDGVPEEVVNKRMVARGNARGEVSPKKQQRAIGRGILGNWGKRREQ